MRVQVVMLNAEWHGRREQGEAHVANTLSTSRSERWTEVIFIKRRKKIVGRRGSETIKGCKKALEVTESLFPERRVRRSVDPEGIGVELPRRKKDVGLSAQWRHLAEASKSV